MQIGKPFPWFKNALGWFGIVLFLSDTGSDGYVGYSLINRCHNYYGSSVLSFFWIPGLLSGGFFFSKMFVDKFLKKYIVYYHPGVCIQTVIFLLGTILGPIVFVPAGLVLLVKAAIDPVDKENYVFPKQKKFAKW